MGLKESEADAIAAFSNDFESALIGLQDANPQVPTISPAQYTLMLAAGIYAAQQLQGQGLTLPSVDTQADFGSFLPAAAAHYAQTTIDVAALQVEQLLGKDGVAQQLLSEAGAGISNLTLTGFEGT